MSLLISSHNLRFFYFMFSPGQAPGGIVEHHRLNLIQRIGKFRLRCFLSFKFLPEIPKILCLIVRQQIENTVRSLYLPLPLALIAHCIIGVGISRVDLHDIMDQHHHHGL